MSVIFRPMEKTDLSATLDLIRELAAHERRPEAATATEDGLSGLLFVDHPIAYGLIAEKDGDVVGYALMAMKFSSFRAQPMLYIEDVYLVEKARGQGNGAAFMAAIAEFGLVKKAVSLEWSALDFNEIAINFYDKIGAETQTGRLFFDGDMNFMKNLVERQSNGPD